MRQPCHNNSRGNTVPNIFERMSHVSFEILHYLLIQSRNPPLLLRQSWLEQVQSTGHRTNNYRHYLLLQNIPGIFEWAHVSIQRILHQNVKQPVKFVWISICLQQRYYFTLLCTFTLTEMSEKHLLQSSIVSTVTLSSTSRISFFMDFCIGSICKAVRIKTNT